MRDSLVAFPPFHRETDEDLSRLVEMLSLALEPDAVELAFRHVPEDRHYRRRFASGTASPARAARRPDESRDGDFALRAPFRADGLVEGQLTLLRRIRRPWTGAERMRFALLAPLAAQVLECAAKSETESVARRLFAAAASSAVAPILVVDAGGAVLFANGAANLLLESRDAVAVFGAHGRTTPLLARLLELACGPVRHERWALTDGRSLEARVEDVEEQGSLRLVTLAERAGLALDDVKPHLEARGVSGRETEVVGCVLQGMRNAEIARSLFISEYTVKDHLKHVFQKLSVSSRGDLVCALYTLRRTGRSEAPIPHSLEGSAAANLKM